MSDKYKHMTKGKIINQYSFRNIAIVFIAMILLLGIGLQAVFRPQPSDASEFHAVAKNSIYSLPSQIGDWVGRDQDIPASAIKLLRPNAIISRSYYNKKTGETASLLIVQSKDARDMRGHFPPVCYPANGYQMTNEMQVDWDADGLLMNGTDYTFSIQRSNRVTYLNVANFIILPNGYVVPNMKALNEAASDYTRFFQGAAQLQLVTNKNYTDEQRQRIFEELVGSNKQIIQTLLNGESYIKNN
ncbi:hypothetical protein KS4_11140 [Poriferisphaera corsica]|uniref:Methanolan biosynthesis EpsI domain-containing protein n=1 Tax=Poriferisphaera corsica TaxID=2528020 RepID=A0A517YS77_9BACT|nr:hypothetical protein KS4_11140 [Poriferisphaera corsica]